MTKTELKDCLNSYLDECDQSKVRIIDTKLTKNGCFCISADDTGHLWYFYALSRFCDGLAFNFDMLWECTDIAKWVFEDMIERNNLKIGKFESDTEYYDVLI
jgi:uncharacterized pyridoxamine 5'-phosphate oxidase family protein